MRDTKGIIISSVKKVAAEVGIVGLTARKIAQAAGVNEGLIYHYFNNLDELICHAYEKESTAIFEEMLGYLKEAHNIPFSFRDRTRLSFHKTWRMMLSDTERQEFLSAFFHSYYFKSEIDFHNKQIDVLEKMLLPLFDSTDDCKQVIYALMTLLYEAANRVVIGMDNDTKDFEERLFKIYFAMIESQLKEKLFI